MYYYLIVVLVAVVFFVVIVVYLSYNINKSLTSTVYPPVENACPDFWLTDNYKRCIVPNISIPDGNWGQFIGNTQKLNDLASKTPITHGYESRMNVTTIDFNNVNWGTLGSSSLCNKKKWADTYGISWDGVSNYNGVCS